MLSTRSFRNFFRPIHPSFSILIFCTSVILSCVLVFILRPTGFSSISWFILAIILLLISVFKTNYLTIIFAFFSGFFLITFRVTPDLVAQNYFRELIGQEVTITGRISKDPESKDSGKVNLNLTDLQIVSSEQPTTFSAHILTQVSNLDVERSDYVTIRGTLSDGFGTYVATIFRPEVIEIKHPTPGDVFLDLRNFFADKIRDFIPAPQNSLAIGYLLGQKTGVESSFQDALRTVGLTHIIVASGAHLSTLVGFARKIFGKFSRFASFLAAALATVFFIGITGLSASMLRAGLVTGLSLILWYFGREIHPLRLIIIVAAATLIFNPSYLTDLAWLLSFAAFIGIMVIAPLLTKLLYGKSHRPNFITSTLLSSVSATLTCTPILLYFFGQISFISLLANLLILPTVSIVMGLTFLTGLFALFLPPLANLFGHIATLILDYQISVVNFFSDQTIFLLKIGPENSLVFLLYIPLIVVLVFALCYPKIKLHLKRH